MSSEQLVSKRITYLERRHDLSVQEFREHWATTHAKIAVDLPGVLSYRQNRVVEASPVSSGAADEVGAAEADHAAEPYLVDGIVELWFGDESSAGAGFGSDVADRLIEDEKRFLSGLTGAAVLASGPTPDWPHKLWLLGSCGDDSGDRDTAADRGADLASWSANIATEIGAAGHQINQLDREAPVLQRDTLRREPRLPDFAISFGFAVAPSEGRLTELVECAAADPRFTRTQVFRVEELRII